MSFESDFCAYLKADATLAATFGTRITPLSPRQQTVYPYITYFMASGQPYTAHDGDQGLSEYRWQVDIYAQDYETIRAARERLRTLFSGKRITMGSTVIQSSFVSFIPDDIDTVNTIIKGGVDLELAY